jgi:hypothetical protein
MKNMQRLLLLLLVAGVMISSAASAQGNAADARYCGKLIKLYRTYVNNPDDPRPTYQSPVAAHELAIERCEAGNTAAGIPVLEKALQDIKMTLPSRGES